MNKIYKLIWSKALDCMVVVPECAKGAVGKKSGRRKLASVVAASLLTTQAWANDLPSGGQIVSGTASINTSGNAMTINQSSDKMITNWQSFSIGTNNSVTFNQPGATSVALNRVVGQDASHILGNLNANGQVFLINPNGVAIGTSGSVQTGGFVTSTLGMTNADFLASNYHFTGNGGAIVNEGNISGNVVALIAPSVTNDGTITGGSLPDSTTGIALAAGTDVLLDFDGDGLLSVEVRASTLATLVANNGLIQADGGVAILTAKGASDALKGVVSNSGVVEANTISSRNGRILLLGDISNGETNVSGTLRAKSVETSAAKVTIDKDLTVDTDGGHWLIDPTDITVDEGLAAATQTSLATGDVTITTASGDSDAGNITVVVPITWNANTLTLRADNNIALNAELTATSTAGLALEYAKTTGSGTYSVSAPINLASTSSFSTQKGSDAVVNYIIITELGVQNSSSGVDLQGMSNNLAGNYVLGANIDASETGTWGSSGFASIGGNATRFTGIFDGLGHTINDLTINRPSENYIGLFGGTSGASIQNISLVDAGITGKDNVGGLVGYNQRSTISNAYVTGSVTAGGDFGSTGGLVGANIRSNISNVYATSTVSGNDTVGGLVGHNYNSSISNAYATGSVSGNDNVGGLVGINGGTNAVIRNAYATGAVSGTFRVGGLLGLNDGGASVSNSYWDIDTTGHASSAGGGTGLTTTEALLQSSYSNFDFNDWVMVDGQTRPFLRSEYSTTIQNTHQLQLMAMDLTADYTLAQHLNFGTTFTDASRSDMWATSTTTGTGFVPIGAAPVKFTGLFDGLGHTISDLTIKGSATNYVGLFGYTSGATIQNIGIVGGSVTGLDNVGGLAGYIFNSRITNAYATGAVLGGNNVGGLVGYNDASDITNAYATASVSGNNDYVGGLVGYNQGNISNAYATGSVSAHNDYGGGLVGYNQGNINNTYAIGSVWVDRYYIGGLAGASSGSITGSFYDKDTTGRRDTGKGDGKTTAEMKDPFTFIDATWNFSDIWGKSSLNENSGYMMLRGVGENTLYDNYVELTGNTTRTYGDENPAMPGFSANSIGEENVTLGWGSAIAAATNVGEYSYSSPNVLDVSTNDGSTYIVYGTGALAINKAALTVTANGQNKTYGDSFAFTGNEFTTSPLKNDETVASVTLASNASSTTANAGSYTITASNATGGTFDINNYEVTYTAGTFNVDKAALNVTANNAAKTYDGQAFTGGNGVSISGFVNGETDAIIDTTGLVYGGTAQNAVNAGSYGLTASGLGAANYDFAYVDGVLAIDKAVISTITGITGMNKTYDGTKNAALNSSGADFTGMVSGDTLAVATATGFFDDKNAGAGKTVSISSLSLSGADAANYTLADTTAVTTANIAPAALTLLDLTIDNKTYDGTTIATVNTLGGLSGLIADDSVTADISSVLAVFSDKNAGDSKTVTLNGITLSGTDAGNYSIDSTASTTADITKAVISDITRITAMNRIYDGSVNATLDIADASFTGIVSGDKLSVATASGSFADKNAGNGKTVSITDLSLGGTDASNYTLAVTTSVATADIAKAVISAITGITAADKTYDGTTNAALETADAGFTGMVSGDALSLASASGSFTNTNAGIDKTVNITNLSIGGADAGNYTLADTTSATTADIAKAVISAITGITAANKTYDGSIDATLDATGVSFGEKSQDQFLSGMQKFEEKSKQEIGKSFNSSDISERETYLRKALDKTSAENEDENLFLNITKNVTILGYMQSEYIMTKEMPYTLIPGSYGLCETIDNSKKINVNA